MEAIVKKMFHEGNNTDADAKIIAMNNEVIYVHKFILFEVFKYFNEINEIEKTNEFTLGEFSKNSIVLLFDVVYGNSDNFDVKLNKLSLNEKLQIMKLYDMLMPANGNIDYLIDSIISVIFDNTTDPYAILLIIDNNANQYYNELRNLLLEKFAEQIMMDVVFSITDEDYSTHSIHKLSFFTKDLIKKQIFKELNKNPILQKQENVKIDKKLTEYCKKKNCYLEITCENDLTIIRQRSKKPNIHSTYDNITYPSNLPPEKQEFVAALAFALTNK